MSDFYSLIAQKYELLKELGRGGMGVVYLANQRDLNRIVALKVVPPTYLANPVSRERFRREIQVMRKLTHPGVVSIYDVEELPDGSSVIVMEYMKGRSLEDIRLEGPVKDWKKVAEWGAKIADALHHAHEKGIVHRDIKPGNIMLLDGGGIKVMDFGIAKAEGGQNLTMDRIIGTPAYMAPEQALGKGVDHRADIYSFGVLLYAMLAGTSPFDRNGDSHSLEVIQRQINETPEFLSSRVQGLPERLVALIHQMISKSPLDRPVDCDDIRRKLEEMLTKKPKKDFFLVLLLKEIFSIGDRLKRDRLKPTDFVMLELLVPGLSKILTHNVGLGLFVAALSGGAVFSPYPITLSILFRLLTAVWTFFSMKGADTKAALDYLWYYQRIPFMGFALILAGGVSGSFIYETNQNVGGSDEGPRVVTDDPRKTDVADSGLGGDRGNIPPTPVDKNDIGLKLEETPTPAATPAPTIATPAPTLEPVATQVVKAEPTPLPTPRPTPTRRGPSALDLVGETKLETPAQATPTPVYTQVAVAAKPSDLSFEALVDDAAIAVNQRNTQRLEDILAYLNGDKANGGNEYLLLRGLLGGAYSWLDSPAYTRRVREGWAYFETDLDDLKTKLPGDKSQAVQEVLLEVTLQQSFNLTINITKRRNLVDFVDPSYGNDLIDAALKSGDRDRQFGALLLLKNRNRPELTVTVAPLLNLNIDNMSVHDAFQEEALSWLERHGTKDALPILEERAKRSDVVLGEKRRIQQAIQTIQKRGG